MLALATGAMGCGGGGEGEAGGGDVAAIESCATGAGFETTTVDVNSLDPKDVDAGVVSMVRAATPDAGVASEVRVFDTAEDAAAWADKQKTYGGTVTYEASGLTVTEVLSVDRSGDDLLACAEENG